MSYSVISIKKKLGLFSLMILTSQVFTSKTMAMGPITGANDLKLKNDPGLGAGPGPEIKMESKISEEKLPSSVELAVQRPLSLSLEEIDGLIVAAKEDNQEAQDTLIEAHSRGFCRTYLTPEKIGFLEWKFANLTETIQMRCAENDSYASYVIHEFKDIEKHFEGLTKQIQHRADQGNAVAQCNLGFMYKEGNGVEKDLNEALRLYTLSANLGYANAQCTLGLMYFNGQWVEKDLNEALRLFTLAVNQDHAVAQCTLGNIYHNGRDVMRNLNEAFRLYTLSANQGYAAAQCILGKMYFYGQGVEKDLNEAIRLYTLSANQGHPGAQCNLGNIYSDGLGVEKDLNEAIRLYTLSANQGFAAAQCNLGNMYETGQGVEKDLNEAIRLYKLAAHQKNAVAQYTLGNMYKTGQGVEINLPEALYWYIKAKKKEACFPSLYTNSNAPLHGESFQQMINDLKLESEGTLSQLLDSHQRKKILNRKDNKWASVFAIPEIGETYEKLEAFDAEIISTLQSLSTIKPGFMVTTTSFSEVIGQWLPFQITPFFDYYIVEKFVDGVVNRVYYFTMGEENVKKSRKFIGLMTKFTEANQNLASIARLYEQGVDSVLAQLTVWQSLALITTSTDEIHEEDGSVVPVKEHFKALACLTNISQVFEEQTEKFNDLKLYIQSYLHNIKEEQELLQKLEREIISVISRGVGARNKDFYESDEYSFLK